MIARRSQLLAVRAVGENSDFVVMAVQSGRFESRRRVPEANQPGAAIPSGDLRAVRVWTYGREFQSTSRLGRAQDGARAIELTMEVAPLPGAAVVVRYIVEGTAGDGQRIELQSAGGGCHIGPVALPAFFLAGLRFLFEGRLAFLGQPAQM